MCLDIRAGTYSFTNVVNTTIPDDNPAGLQSTIDVAGVVGTVSHVSLFLDISGGTNGDLYATLAQDNGGFAVLLNRPGKTSGNPFGYADAGLSVTLDDSAPGDIHTYGGNSGNPLTGLWQPDARNVDPQLVLDLDPRTAYLNSFNGLDANTTWTFFIADFATGGTGVLTEWQLIITTVPEPTSATLLIVGSAAFFVHRRKLAR